MHMMIFGQSNSEEREKASADKLFSLLPENQGKEIRELWEEFDKRESNDGKYAAAMDCLQPFLHNYYTQGEMWKFHKVKSSQVYKRMERVKNGAPELWPFVDNLIKDAVKKEYLQER